MTKTCGVMTENGPCTMKPGHEARYHRHRTYDALQWEIYTGDYSFNNPKGRRLASGEGVNALTTAISKNRVSGTKLVIEINC